MNTVQTLNYVVNFFWTIIGFLPLTIYWWQTPLTFSFYCFLMVSVFLANVPERMIHQFRFSSKRRIYELVGVRLVRKFVQDGDYIRKGNHWVRSKAAAEKYLLRILMYERFHTLCFLFFTFSMTHALLNARIKLGLMILFCNVFFNVYPLLLQQYNRLRILRLIEKGQT
ncbi:hypothetical protein [Daejeonella sp.]|uniref:glycosyl-4,4'-diaponeurosporenoate acyltransferase CrtO family protein n=1 Tax=Daejeonella sp. TaxID=2805397 RepID=UPI0030BAA634